MTGRQRLDRYLHCLRSRLRAHIYVRAFAAAAGGLLLITCAAVWWLRQQQFAPEAAFLGRVGMIITVLVILAALWLTPLRRLHRNEGAHQLEASLPAQCGRIQTYLESRRQTNEYGASPLIDLLAEDALAIAQRTPVESIVSNGRLSVMTAVGIAASTCLVLLLAVGPAHWGFGARHLLLGSALPRTAAPLRRILVQPGDATVRRNTDLPIRAEVSGFRPERVDLVVRFANETEWERAPMQPAAEEGTRFEFELYAVRGPLSYYVDAYGVRSAEHNVSVVDLPKIERMRLTYSYPEWTGLGPVVEEERRDIRAVGGTSVKIEVFADAPLDAPALIVDGAVRELAHEDRASVGFIDVQKPGRYQIGARVADEFVALSDEYAIEIIPDEKPVVEIRKPGRDSRATSIEEVPVRIEAQDDFRLRNVELRYSVNGGAWRSVPLEGGAKRSETESLLRLEELMPDSGSAAHLAPGDLVSYYAVARDRSHAAQTDLFLVQVQPFERRFTQAQGGAGGAGMSDDQGAVSERQREILLATWNLQRNDERNTRTRAQLEDSAKMLAELQATLAQQARTLAERTRARASLEDERIKIFVESLERAAAAMDPAAKRLSEFRLADAVPEEQQALQQLLRAEAAFREVQVSMQRSSPGASAQNSRSFAEMFELEMDLEKNQYETESQLSMQSAQQEREEAIRKLKELAARQEKLADQANRSVIRAQEQRWKQEQLRREAEDLRRRLAEMNQQQGSQSEPSAQTDAKSGQASAGVSEENDSGKGLSVGQALESINRALDDMRAANERSGRDQTSFDEAAREAGRSLRQALKEIDRPAAPAASLAEVLDQLAGRAQRIGEDQRRMASDLYEALSQIGADQFGGRGFLDRRKVKDLVEAKQKMSEELTAVQRELRNTIHEHRDQQPNSARRVSEIIRELERSEVMYRLNRSAAEIYYGRGREAAMREGLIAETLETLERDLRGAAALAAQEAKTNHERSTPEALLAEAAQMRRALQSGEPEPQNPRHDAGGNAQRVLSADADARRNPPGQEWDRRESLAREIAAIGQRVRDAANRINRGELTQAQFDALRRRANELRRLAGDPMADQAAMLKLIDQIELAALFSAPNLRDSPARAMPPPEDSPQYREAVAEYYRRLGNQ
ncbi:MAG TPA: hypothetical protein VHK24_04135 [Steroidobacter sp.]|nr:hypothetical protein [Steroidobacter sp.]